MVIFKVFLRFNDKADQHISNSHKPRIRNKIPFISSMLTILMMPGYLPQLRALCSCCFSECLVDNQCFGTTSCSGKLEVRNRAEPNWYQSVSGIVGNGWGEDPIAGGKRLLLTKQVNKQKPPRRGKTDWLDWTRQDWTQDIRRPNIWYTKGRGGQTVHTIGQGTQPENRLVGEGG